MREELAKKYCSSKWEQYKSYHLKKSMKNDDWFICERLYDSYDKPDWTVVERVSSDDAEWLHKNSSVKKWY